MTLTKRIQTAITDVPDFPKPGVIFKDISGLLADQTLCNDLITWLASFYVSTKPDAIVCLESRGFMTGMLLANRLNVPFIMARKPGKLPGETYTYSYDLEYGFDTVQIQKSMIKPGMKILIHDDIIATGGTAKAVAKIVKYADCELIGFCFIASVTVPNTGNVIKTLETEFDTTVITALSL